MSFTWGMITGTSPIRVQLDGDTAAVPITPDSMVDPAALVVGDRVRCELTGRRLIVHGAPRLATLAQAAAGTDVTRALTPAGARAFVNARGGLVPIVPTSVAVGGSGSSATVNSSGRVLFANTTSGVLLNGVFSAGYRHYLLRATIYGSPTSGEYMYLRLAKGGADTGGTQAYYYQLFCMQSASVVGFLSGQLSGMPIGYMSEDAATPANSYKVEISSPFWTAAAGAPRPGFLVESQYGGSSQPTNVHGGGLWNGNGAFDGLRLWNGGNYVMSGEVQVLAYE